MRIGSDLLGATLTAQHQLVRAYAQMSRSNTRLSTMRRVNSGRDDPAALIAIESLRAELTAINRASDNAARAGGMARVADAALSEVSDLLNTIRDYAVASAGNLQSDVENRAMQIEVDAALHAIDLIGNTTSFGGRRLLDGATMTFLFSPDVSQTTTLELPTIDTTALGNSAGRLSDLASGGDASLEQNDLAATIEILDAARQQVVGARARLGATERYTIDASQRLLGDMAENLTGALSEIRDTDVAFESSLLVGSQILAHAGILSLLAATDSGRLVGYLLDEMG